jgi:transcription elongation factor GreB
VADAQGETHEYRIVGADESDAGKRYISVDSPLARALLGKEVDDAVAVELPGGVANYELVTIRYP